MAQNPDDFHKLLGRALTDDQFRTKLQKNPEAALKEAGIEPSPEKVAALKAARESITKAHQAFGGGGMARPS